MLGFIHLLFINPMLIGFNKSSFVLFRWLWWAELVYVIIL